VTNTAVYTSNFTPSTTPLTAISGTKILLMQNNFTGNNNAFYDASANNFAITRNGNTTQGTFTPYGSNWSNNFNGSTGYLTVPSSSLFKPASSDFTIEAWVYPTVAQTSGLILIGQGDLGTAAGSSYYFSVGSAGDCSVYVGGTTYTITAPNPSTGQWSHVALVRSGNTLSSYRNGTRIGTGSVTGTVNNGTATYYPSSGGISNVAGGANFTGYMSNLRRIVGSGGYNAASATITVPTAPLTATANTTLLVFQDGYSPFKDASTAATPMSSLYNRYSANTVPRGTFLTPFDSSTYTNIARVYEWTSSGSITF